MKKAPQKCEAFSELSLEALKNERSIGINNHVEIVCPFEDSFMIHMSHDWVAPVSDCGWRTNSMHVDVSVGFVCLNIDTIAGLEFLASTIEFGWRWFAKKVETYGNRKSVCSHFDSPPKIKGFLFLVQTTFSLGSPFKNCKHKDFPQIDYRGKIV